MGGGNGGRGGTSTGPEGGQTDEIPEAGDGVLARVRPRRLPGAPSRRTVRWVDPSGMPIPGAGVGSDSATGSATSGEAGAIERAPLPEDYQDHVREFFGGD
jgi:hypothetical protein